MGHSINTLEKTNMRTALWDNIKFLMITLMVIGHFADAFTSTSSVCRSIYLFIYAFHMPLFIFISGLFYHENGSKQKIVYYASCGFALKIALSCISSIISKSPDFSLLSDAGIPWFMFSLAEFQAVMYLFKEINKKYLLIFNIILACFVGYDQTVGDWLYLSRSIVFFPFFLLGTMLAQQTIINSIRKYFRLLLPISVFILALWFYLCFFKIEYFYIFRPLLTGRNPFMEPFIDYGPLARFTCYLITFVTGTSFLVIIPKSKIPFVTFGGTKTMNVFFWHWPAYLLFAEYLKINKLFDMSFGGKIAFLFIAVLLSITLLSIKIFDYPLIIIKRACFPLGKTEK